jgi:DNA-binding MarR family transcriptional regulator
MSTELSRHDHFSIGALVEALDIFLSTGAVPMLLPVFLHVARFPGRTAAEMARQEKVPLATMSRHLLTLGHGSLGLVQTRVDPRDTRQIGHALTVKGVSVARRMLDALAAEREAA